MSESRSSFRPFRRGGFFFFFLSFCGILFLSGGLRAQNVTSEREIRDRIDSILKQSDADSPSDALESDTEDDEESADAEEPAAKDGPPRKGTPASPLRSLADAAGELAFREKSRYVNDKQGNGKFHGAFVSVAWDGFAGLAEYCDDHQMELRLEFLPLMNMFDVGKCRRVKRTEAPDGGWVYDFFWKPNNGRGKEQSLLTVTLSESGLSAEQNECLDSTLSGEAAILALDHIRLGVLRWSLLDEGAPDDEPAERTLTFVTPLFAAAEISDKFEPSPQPISIGDRLQKKEVLPDLNFDADTKMKVTLASCQGLNALAESGRTSFLLSDGSFQYTITFAVTPTPKSADDLQLVTVALIDGVPADEVVKEFFYRSGMIEQVNAAIYEREMIIAGLESSYVLVPNVSSSDPVVQKEIFSQRKRLERINRNIDSRIRKYSGQIGRLRKSLDVELSKRLKKNLKFFQDRFAVTYKISLTNRKIGPDEFLLCDSFAERNDYETRDDENAGNGLEDDVFDADEFDPGEIDPDDAIDDESDAAVKSPKAKKTDRAKRD
ncbi:MAG: hypothetical protein K6E55_01685 [Thermoguttaceae bacterium]|nr:hypothetical protein [Thermoguttaceae bacterium]